MQQPTKSGDALRPIRFGVNHRALIQRINRVLKASNEQLKAVGELGAVVGAGKQVTVTIRGHLDGGMPEPPLHDLDG
jgi:hypothetical protein